MRILVTLLTIWMCSACGEEPDCDLEQPADEISVNFYSIKDSTELYKKFFYVGADGTDSVYYNSTDSIPNFHLKLNPSATQVQYIFLSGVSTDILTIKYTKRLEWLSEACGPSFFYDNLEIEYSTFNAHLVSSTIDNQIDENIKIYN